jgi:hypothetical protein
LTLLSSEQLEQVDLDAIIIYFSNENASGGAEILDFKLDDFCDNKLYSRRQLKLKYKSSLAMERVKKRKSFYFKNYKFDVVNDYDTKETTNMRTIILTKCLLDESSIKMFAENLSPLNSTRTF